MNFQDPDERNPHERFPHHWVAPLCFCVAIAFLLPSCAKEKKPPLSAVTPDFTLKTLDDQEITLSNLKGKVVLLDFWATWCAPCRESIPHLVQLYRAHQGRGFEVVGISLDKGDKEIVRRFVQSMDIPYPIVIAPENVVRSYQVNSIPNVVFIDREGKIREKIVGFSTVIAQQMETKVGELLSEKP